MGLPATKKSFQPRQNLKRKLTFRPMVKTAYHWYLVYLAAQSVYLAWDFLIQIRAGVPAFSAFQWAPWAFLGVGFVISFFVLKQLTETEVYVDESGVRRETLKNNKVNVLLFEDMVELTLPSSGWGFRGVFSVEMKSGETFYFSVLLERSEYLLEAIAAKRPDLVELESMSQFRIDAIATDHFISRLKSNIDGSWRRSLVRYFISPLLQALVIHFSFKMGNDSGATLATIWIYFAVVNAGIGIFSDFALNFWMKSKTKKKLLQNPASVIRDLRQDQRISLFSEVLHWSLSLCFFLFFFYHGWGKF